MKKIVLNLVFVGLLSGIFAQNKTPIQPILNLSVDELSKIGIFIKNNKVIVKNVCPNGLKFPLILYKNSYSAEVGDTIASTNYDFYPYYISTIDSVSGFLSLDDERENKIKMDPLFERKMKLNYLVPVQVKIPPDQDYLFWFQPTETFCKLIPQKYPITIKYVPDSLINSNVALDLTDEELKKIGFVIDDEEMYLRTWNKPDHICEWFNNKTESGTSLLSGNIENLLKNKDKKNRKYDISKTDYHIVRVTDADGEINFNSSKYKGLVIPIYIKNKHRSFNNKHDTVIYLSYSPSLVKKMDDNHWGSWWENPAKYTLDVKNIDAH
jgi:hypothetical protein